MNNIFLNIKGNSFEGWKSVAVSKSMSQICGAFSLVAADKHSGKMEKWGISMGDSCSVKIKGTTVIQGHVEDISISYDKESHEIQVGGRDITGDLVDCSRVEKPNEWKGQYVEKIITDLCSPLGIPVVIQDDIKNTESEDTAKAEEGASIFDMIVRICRDHGFLPLSYGDGKLTITRAGDTKANDSLELGKNVKVGMLDQSDKDRFSLYVVKGQGISEDSNVEESIYTHSYKDESDNMISRYRPILLFTEKPVRGNERCKHRAIWESNTRAGMSRKLEYTVQDWVQSNGEVWPLNSLVRVKDTFLGINSTLLISDLNFTANDSEGKITHITVVDPKCFTVLRSAADNIGTDSDLTSLLRGTR